MNMDQIIGLLGILVGALFAGAGLWWELRRATKNRGRDERQQIITSKSLRASWFVTLGSLYCIFTLYLLGMTISVPVALSILVFIQLGSWTLSQYYYHNKY